MAIITKGSNLEKGNEVEFTLNITDLLAHASVSGDAYFSDQSRWDKVFLNYTSAGYQKEILIFKNVDSGTSSVANFGVFSNARDLFEVHSIIIMDKQGGCLKINRSDLVVADFDVDFGGAGGGGTPLNLITSTGSVDGNIKIDGSNSSFGQTYQYTGGSGAYNINEIDLMLTKSFSPIGNVKVEVYDSVGGSLLGTSDEVDTSTLPTSYGTLVSFLFSTPVSGLTDGGTYYFKLVAGTGFAPAGAEGVRVYTLSSNPVASGEAHLNDAPLASDLEFTLKGTIGSI